MILISYDIANDKLRTQFSKMLQKQGAIRLQYSVYEFANTKRMVDNMKLVIEQFATQFDAEDSIVVFEVSADKITKYGNAIHRDRDIVYL